MAKLAAWLLGVKALRPVQRAGYDRLRNKPRRLLTAPQGCGKTLLTKTIALEETLFDGVRVLIAVPQRNIGVQYGGSGGERLWLPCRAWTGPAFAWAAAATVAATIASACCWGGESLFGSTAVLPLWWLWRRMATRPWTAVNKCEDTDRTVDEVEAFILGGEGVMVCCTASLARAWSRIGDASAVRGLSLWVDESHYVKAGDEQTERNRVGDMVHALIRSGGPLRESLVTATPFRGDGDDMVHRDDAPSFTKFECPWDRHFKENMPSVEHVNFFYLWYSTDEERDEKLAEYLGNVGNRSLVYIPHPASMLSSRSRDGRPKKIVDRDRVMAAIENVDPGAEVIDLVTDRRNGGDQSAEMAALQGRIADVVSRSGEGWWRRRWTGLTGWLCPGKARPAASDPDYVVALNLMKVGSDWPNLRSIADLAPSDSRTDGAQKFGRLSREPTCGVDKRTISYALFFPTLGRLPDEEMRIACSRRLTSLISALLLEYATNASLFERRSGGTGGGGEGEVHPDRDRIEEEFLAALVSREGGCEHETCASVAERLMDEMDIPSEMRGRLMRIVRWANRRPTGDTAAALERIDEVHYGELGAMMVLTAGDCGVELFERHRRMSRYRASSPAADKQIVEAIREHMEANQNWQPGARGRDVIPGVGMSCKQLDYLLRNRGDTLDRLLRREGLLPPKLMTDGVVVRAIRARMAAEAGWYPSRSDASALPGLPFTSCKKIDSMIRNRRGGFARERDTLLKMLRRSGMTDSELRLFLHRGPRKPTFTEESIIGAIKARMESEPGWWPTSKDTVPLEGLGASCSQIADAIRGQLRGLALEGDTFGKMLRRNGIVKPRGRTARG